jgi:glycosyltransferase involved in cell wall biosynthesis
LYSNPYFIPYRGGIETFIEELHHELRRRGDVDECWIATTSLTYPSGRILNPSSLHDGMRIVRLASKMRTPPWFYYPSRSGILITGGRRLRHVHADVLHLANHGAPALHRLVQRSHPATPSVFSPFFHPTSAPAHRLSLLRAMGRKVLANATLIHCTSATEISQLEQFYGLAIRDKCIVVTLGVDDWPATLPTSGRNAHRLLTVGRFEAAKGHRYVLDVVSSLRRQGIPVSAALVGSDGPAVGLIVDAIRRLGIESHVDIVIDATESDLAREYSNASIFVSCSEYETFGVAAVRAMAAALPVVAFSAGQLAQVLGRAGVVVAYGDSGRLAEAVGALLGDSEALLASGRVSRARYETEYSWTSVGPQYSRLYQMALTVAS